MWHWLCAVCWLLYLLSLVSLDLSIYLFTSCTSLYPASPRSKKQPVPSPHPLSILNLTTATLFYHNLPNSQLHRLQLIQNSLTRTVFNTPKTCHITPLLASLHWLKIKERIEYKLLSLTYKILTTSQATYLHNLVSLQSPRGTRSHFYEKFLAVVCGGRRLDWRRRPSR